MRGIEPVAEWESPIAVRFILGLIMEMVDRSGEIVFGVEEFWVGVLSLEQLRRVASFDLIVLVRTPCDTSMFVR